MEFREWLKGIDARLAEAEEAIKAEKAEIAKAEELLKVAPPRPGAGITWS